MSLAGLVAAFEQACRDAQVASTRAAAEQSLKSFFSHPDAISLAVAVTETTNSSVARFHAAGALHAAARDRWVSLQPTQRYGKDSLRYWIINHVIASPSLVAFERRSLLRTAAFLTRRAYLEESRYDKDAFFSSLHNTLTSQSAQQHVAVAAIELIDLILDEFLTPSPSHPTSGVEHLMFTRAREEFAAPNGDIIGLLKAASASLSMLLQTGPGMFSAQDWGARVAPALSAIFKIITADSKSPSISKNENSRLSEPHVVGIGSDKLDTVVINRYTGSEWVSMIEQIPQIKGICFSITALHLSEDADTESQVMSRAAQVIIAIAAISHKSYTHTDIPPQDVLVELLAGMDQQKWSSSQIGLVRLAYAEVWKRISCAHGLVSVESLPQNWLNTFTKDTCEELDAAAVRLSNPDGQDDVFSMDVVDLLLETWANLALQGDDGSLTDHRLSSSIEEIISRFMRTFLRSSGGHASLHAYSQKLDTEEDLGFEDTSIDDSRLCVAACLTRFVLDRLASQIRHYLMSVAHRVCNWEGGHAKTQNTLSVFQEDLCFLVHFTCAVLADEAKGEVPSVPTQFLRSVNGSKSKICTKHGAQVQILLHAVTKVAQGETFLISQRGLYSDEASPRVGTAILDGLSRLCRTYLVPINAISIPTMIQLVGGEHFINSSINVCFEKATEGILRRGVEADVAESAAVLISHLATGAKRFQNVRESNYWQALLGQGVEMYQSLPSRAVEEMGRALTTVLGDVVVERLLLPAYKALRGFADAQERLVDAAERAIAIVNLLGGAAKSEELGNRTRTALVQSLETPDGIAASCSRAFSRNRPDVSRSLVSLADKIIYSNLSLLQGDEARGLVENAVKLLASHTDIVGSQKDSLSIDEVARDTEEVLALLTHILEEAVDIDTDDACYYGLSKLLPIMSEVLLDLPHVGTHFFLFVTQLVCRYPEKLSSLPPELCKQILQTIDMQRTSVDVIAERRGLDAVTALGRAWVAAKARGPGSEAIGEGLHGYVRSIFNGVATGAAHTSNLDAAADAMLPLLHTKPSGSVTVMEELGQALLVSSGQNDGIRAALEELARVGSRASSMHGYGLPSDDVANRRSLQVEATKSFREAVARFSSNAKNALLSAVLGHTATKQYLT